jgi:hypothetical protein
VNGISTSTSPNIPQVLKGNWSYDLPIGRGHWLLGNAPAILQHAIGGWQFNGTARLQSGDPIDVGNVRLIGMTRKDLQNALHIRMDDTARRVWSLPQDIIDNTVRANNVSATSATGYSAQGVPTGRYIAPANSRDCLEFFDGDCGASSVIVYGPRYVTLDLSTSKQFKITEHVNFEIKADMFNALNNTNFTVPLSNLATTFGQVTAADGARSMQLTGRINW